MVLVGGGGSGSAVAPLKLIWGDPKNEVKGARTPRVNTVWGVDI